MEYFMTKPAGGASMIWSAGIIIFLALLTTFLIVMLFTSRNYVLRIEGDQLSISSTIYNTKISIDEIDIQQIQSVQYSDLNIRMRTNGLSVPGLHIGWFSGDGQRYKLYVTDPDSVLLIPTKLGYSIAFSTTEAESIISDITQQAR